MKISYARELMRRDEGLSLSEIALISGFGSYVSFWSQFKRISGTTPSEADIT